MQNFKSLGLGEKILKALTECDHEIPTKIQEKAIVPILKNSNVLGLAATGTGKTAAFVLPILERLEGKGSRGRMPRCLILEPTRELAHQVHEKITMYGKYHSVKNVLLIGGVGFQEQAKRLRKNVDIIIATPGRLMDHFERGNVLLTGLDILVLDEADRMLDMGFMPIVKKLFTLTAKRSQTLCFSATMLPAIEKLCQQFVRDPVRIEVLREETQNTIDQMFVMVDSHKKNHVLTEFLQEAKALEQLSNGILFCNRKRDIADIKAWLIKKGFRAKALHGDLNQHVRNRVLEDFRANKFSLLIASDVASRGLDIPAVSHVINYDVPDPISYIHRIGRTGRAGRKGFSLTLVIPTKKKAWREVEAKNGENVRPWKSKNHASPSNDEKARPWKSKNHASPSNDEKARPWKSKNHASPSNDEKARPWKIKNDLSSSRTSGKASRLFAKAGTSQKKKASRKNHLPSFLRKS